MEYAPGRTLAKSIPAKGLGITQALRYGVQIADALAIFISPSRIAISGSAKSQIWRCRGAPWGFPVSYAKASARSRSVASPGSFGFFGLPGWMIATWQLSAASTSCA